MIAHAVRCGTPIPKRIAEFEPLPEHLLFYYQAFIDLDTCRTNGMSVGAIPWTAICDYANEYELDDTQRDCFFDYIRGIDSALLSKEASKSHGNK